MSKKRSIIWGIPKQELESIVSINNTFTGVLDYFGLSNKGGNHKTLKTRLIEEKIDYSHIALGLNNNKGRKFPNARKIPLEHVLIEGSTYGRGNLKTRLIKEGILVEICNECNHVPEWNNKPLVLVLDHINGINNDNRLKNLQLLCPNCNSQTPTFAGRNMRHKISRDIRHKQTSRCKCGSIISKNSKECKNCYIPPRKAERPSCETLINHVEAIGYLQTGKLYGVSDNAIRKWIRSYGVTLKNIHSPYSPNSKPVIL